MKYLNLACGAKVCRQDGWVNCDFQNSSKGVLKMNLLKNLKFDDNSADVIYHSQFLEHLNSDEALKFLIECKRVLKKGGIMRIVTPDMQNQVNEYLNKLQNLDDDIFNRNSKEDQNQKNLTEYIWIKLEIIDQLTRNYSGGEMLKLLKNSNIELEEYCVSRLGRSGSNLFKEVQDPQANYLNKIRRKINYFIRNLFPFYTIGKFRNNGEPHRFIYDKVDLYLLLKRAGFEKIFFKTYNTSCIPNWNNTLLDVDEFGTHDSGCSLFCEVIK